MCVSQLSTHDLKIALRIKNLRTAEPKEGHLPDLAIGSKGTPLIRAFPRISSSTLAEKTDHLQWMRLCRAATAIILSKSFSSAGKLVKWKHPHGGRNPRRRAKQEGYQ